MWIFIQDQILGMKWLNVMIGNLLTVLGYSQYGIRSCRWKACNTGNELLINVTSVTLKVISFTYHQREKRALFYSIS